MTRIRLALMLYFFMVANKAACQTLFKAFLKSHSEVCLFYCKDLLRLRLQSVQYDLQHDFALVTDDAYCSVVLALLQIAFLGKCDDQGLGPRG